MQALGRTNIPRFAVGPANYTGAASGDKWIGLKEGQRVQFLIITGAWAGGAAAVTLRQATSNAGAGAKALAFTKQWNDVAASGDLVETAVVSDTFDVDTASKLYVIEVDASELDTNNGFAYVNVDLASPGANDDFYAVIAQLLDLRYQSKTPIDPND